MSNEAGDYVKELEAAVENYKTANYVLQCGYDAEVWQRDLARQALETIVGPLRGFNSASRRKWLEGYSSPIRDAWQAICDYLDSEDSRTTSS